jgi:hypothetical protein
MIKEILMLSATVVSCYAMEKETDPTAEPNLTTSSAQVVVEKVDEVTKEKVIEGGAGTYPVTEPKVETTKSKGSLWCGCGSADAIIDTNNVPQELKISADKGTSAAQVLQQSEIVLSGVDGNKSNVDAPVLTVTEENGNGAATASGSGNLWGRIWNWRSQGNGSKDTQVLAPVDTSNVVDHQPVATVVDVTDASQEEGKEEKNDSK